MIENYENYRLRLLKSFNKRIKYELLEEMINDSFIILMKKYDEKRANPYTFLYTIVDNRIKMYYKRKKMDFVDDFNVEYGVFEEEVGEGYDFETDNNRNILEDEINKLEKWRMIAIWYFIKKIRSKDISSITNTNENTIKSRIKKIKKTLKNNIIKNGIK